MTAKLESIIAALKAAREAKGLSQRALADRVGIPQSHISKIESGAVDLQTSSLIELARALDLELTLLPRSVLATVQALRPRTPPRPDRLAKKLIDRDLVRIANQARQLAPRFPQTKALERLNRTAEELRPLQFGGLTTAAIHERAGQITETLQLLHKQRTARLLQSSRDLLNRLELQTEKLRQMRNALAHGMTDTSAEAIPAYRLDDDGESNG
ncbi:MAG: helix-turn-helix domain-containing protein [Steroidobacteraceae bacterium]